MSLRLYDSASRELRDFVPLREGHASVYLCGATPQAKPHIGHLRSAVAFDILRRWLLAQGFDVAFVRNITDIDDKILTKAAEAGRPWWEWVTTHEREFTRAYDLLGVLPPSVEPRATGHVTQMVQYMQRLIEAGFAYAAAGSVYFDTVAWSKAGDYGVLSGNRLEDMLDDAGSAGSAGAAGGAVAPEDAAATDRGQRDPRDFALWKAAKSGEPSWPTPWGDGRPGWHLECSAMATYYLGGTFDIHCGGLDLRFPHHENEIAQSHAAGDDFARYWLHNHWVTLAGEKMSKSLGNTLSIDRMLELVRPVELRYYLGSAHYRSVLEYSEDALIEAAAGYRRIEDAVRRVAERMDMDPDLGDVPEDFTTALDDDLAVPAALAALHAGVKRTNTAVAEEDAQRALAAAGEVRAMAAVLGVDPLDPQWVSGAGGGEADSAQRHALDTLIGVELERRTAARAAKDWATADEVRDRLAAAGIEVTDTPTGPMWSLKEGK